MNSLNNPDLPHHSLGTLSQLRISEYIIHLIFDQGDELSIESTLEDVAPDGAILSTYKLYGDNKDITIHRLLGNRSTGIAVESDKTLTLAFGDHGGVRITRTLNQYESGTLSTRGTVFVF